MENFTHYTDIEVIIPDDVYMSLNKASREYDMEVNDLYYFIINGGKFQSQFFEEVFKEALDAYFKYAEKRDLISNTYVIPEIKKVYGASDDKIISNYWNINFDGSRVCRITDIEIKENDQTTLYQETADDKWIHGIPILHAKIEIFDNLITKLASSIKSVTGDSIKIEYKNIRDARIAFAMEEDVNRAKLLNEVITPIIEGHDPAKCIWDLNPVSKMLTITETK